MIENPYFKFYIGEWLTGDITICDLSTQAIFIQICCFYWSSQGSICLANVKQRFKQNENEIKQLLEYEILKLDDSENVYIDFLDNQLKYRKALHVKRVTAGRKGGKANAKQVLSKREANKSNNKSNSNNKKKESIKKEYVCENPPNEQVIYLYMISYGKDKLDTKKLKHISEEFYNHYSSEECNWTYMAGGTKRTKLLDWKAKARQWVLKESK